MVSNILSFLTFLRILTIVLECILKGDSLKDHMVFKLRCLRPLYTTQTALNSFSHSFLRGQFGKQKQKQTLKYLYFSPFKSGTST